MNKEYTVIAKLIVNSENLNSPSLDDMKIAIEDAISTPDNELHGIRGISVKGTELLFPNHIQPDSPEATLLPLVHLYHDLEPIVNKYASVEQALKTTDAGHAAAAVILNSLMAGLVANTLMGDSDLLRKMALMTGLLISESRPRKMES